MSVIGHGIDLVELAALRRWIEDPRDPFVSRCFTADEIKEIGNGPDRIARLGGRFAAKEAVLKALGTGFGAGISFKDVVVRRKPGGPPEVVLSGRASSAAQDLGIIGWQLSISHTGDMAIASAIALGVATQIPPPSAGPK